MEYKTFDGGETPFHRFLVFGDTGTGKTGCLVRAFADRDLDMESDAVLDGDAEPAGDPGIFLLATEVNGLATARAFNPKLRYMLASTKKDAQEILGAAAAGELAQDGIHTLAVDGGTEIQRLLKDAQIGENLENASQDKFDYTLFNETTRRFLRRCRNIPLHLVMSALVRTKGNEETDEMELWPSFEGGKLPGEAAQYFSAVGYATKVKTLAGPKFGVQFSDLPARFKVKSAGKISKTLIPCAQAWMAVLDGRLDRKSARLVLPTSAELLAKAAEDAATKPAAGMARPGGSRPRKAPSADTTTDNG